ncbi:N,N'-diacetylbacillosaminyl-diphospho-undecaprenol alpha-1,3-N-acetylgalactosaminyltransferase [Helicobacter pullorum]|uniref:N, N'-diacetylbacillosaminyl-diphospho-undecaprenol alpha-1,3-N-acetylgalactosaminyltransferase n=1 Tax=Helicobacter pullorum TaxID=35818 RepID=UPI0006CE0BA4|nr:N,N'-diacetylbacillosaminyl-diphospho-undecaprenol alpha-1,3-N-acetylgalactosaminyltransferase [Helicobacter pullorum]KPH53737.1 galactosyltransferase [Helicobacter pullorum]
MKILFLSHTDSNLYRFRLPVMIALVKEGHQVVALVPKGECFEKFSKHNIKAINYLIQRSSLNPLKALKTIQNIAEILKQEKPDIIHTFMLKPNIYGSFAAKIAGIPYVINSLTGLGSFYIQKSLKTTLLRILIEKLNFFAFKIAKKVLFQNQDDLNLYVQKGLVPREKTILIKGSGIDTALFSPFSQDEIQQTRKNLKIPQDKIIILMVARAILHKGIKEYYQAAKIITRQNPKILFLYIGGIDNGNIAPITQDFLESNPQVHYLGEKDNIKEWIGICDIFVLPSYREGIPRTLLEAGSMAKPIITTNAVGCKEVVEEGKNGFLVPIGESEILAQKILELSCNQALREQFGKNSQEKIRKEFSVETIVESYLKLYKEVKNV